MGYAVSTLNNIVRCGEHKSPAISYSVYKTLFCQHSPKPCSLVVVVLEQSWHIRPISKMAGAQTGVAVDVYILPSVRENTKTWGKNLVTIRHWFGIAHNSYK